MVRESSVPACYSSNNLSKSEGCIQLSKKQVWYEVEENETIEQCLDRMNKDGYMPFGRKEEPVFHIVDGEPTYLRQKIKFKGILIGE